MNNLNNLNVNPAIELGSLYNKVDKFNSNSIFDKIKTDLAFYFRGGIQENLDNNNNLMYGEFIVLTNMYRVKNKDKSAFLSKNGNKLVTVMNKDQASVFQILRVDPRSKIARQLFNSDNDNNVFIGDNIVLNYVCEYNQVSSTSIRSGSKVSILSTKNNCGQELDVGLIEQTNREPQINSQFIIQFPNDSNKQEIPNNSIVNFVNNSKNLCINTCNYVNNDNESLRLSSTKNNVKNRQKSSTQWMIERVQNAVNLKYVSYKFNTSIYPEKKFDDFGLINKDLGGNIYLWGYSNGTNITWMGITNFLGGNNQDKQNNFRYYNQWWRKDESTDSKTDSWNEKYLGINNNVPILLPFVPVTVKSYNNSKAMEKNQIEINKLSSNIGNVNNIDDNFISQINNLDDELKIIDLQLNSNKNRNNRIIKEIEDKKNLILTRKRMLELSKNKNVYKQKLIYTYIAVIIGLILILLISYYYFNK